MIMTNSPENIEGLHYKLNQTLKAIPNSDEIILMGDFNA